MAITNSLSGFFWQALAYGIDCVSRRYNVTSHRSLETFQHLLCNIRGVGTFISVPESKGFEGEQSRGRSVWWYKNIRIDRKKIRKKQTPDIFRMIEVGKYQKLKYVFFSANTVLYSCIKTKILTHQKASENLKCSEFSNISTVTAMGKEAWPFSLKAETEPVF